MKYAQETEEALSQVEAGRERGGDPSAEAAVELHGTVGPASTKLTELAKLAGVSRMTVYNHFPTEHDLFVACSTHWASQNPFPDPQRWRAYEDADERLGVALAELYAWYERNQGMVENVLRDAPLVPAVEPIVDEWWGGYVDEVVEVLAEGRNAAPGAPEPALAALRLVVDFHTWRLLAQAGLTPGAAADLTSRMVSGLSVLETA